MTTEEMEREIKQLKWLAENRKREAEVYMAMFELERENARFMYSQLAKAAPDVWREIRNKLNQEGHELDKVHGAVQNLRMRVTQLKAALRPFVQAYEEFLQNTDLKEPEVLLHAFHTARQIYNQGNDREN